MNRTAVEFDWDDSDVCFECYGYGARYQDSSRDNKPRIL